MCCHLGHFLDFLCVWVRGEAFLRNSCGESLNFLHLHSSCAIQPSFSPNLWGVQLLFQWSSGILVYYLYWIICLISLIIYPYFRSNVLSPFREDFEIWSSNPIHRLSADQRPMLSIFIIHDSCFKAKDLKLIFLTITNLNFYLNPHVVFEDILHGDSARQFLFEQLSYSKWISWQDVPAQIIEGIHRLSSKV